MSDKDIEHPLVIFDGVCNYCCGVVNFIIGRDPRGVFRFAPFQSDAAKRILKRYNYPVGSLDSFVLIDWGKLYTKSEAGLRVQKLLGGVHKLLYAFIAVPRPLRDAVYDYIARNRYKWYGKKDECMIPDPEMRSRFLE
ncbi:MAG: thiol-disulfide oxidoreductase DCC family protein [Candidatus Dadabacteria bacterium]|nr:thiol-disulfide oxidoreductase DCC family protein [Candidatus Dadabacteria bacterium]